MAAAHYTSDRRAFGNWLSGFVDGEGMFRLVNYRPRGYDLPHARFEIHLRADDRAILDSIHEFWGVGRFYERPERTHGRHRVTSRPQVNYRVGRVEDLASVIVPHFEEFPLRAKKRNDFLIWKRGIEILHRVKRRPIEKLTAHWGGTKPRWTESDIAEFNALLIALKEGRSFDAVNHVVPEPKPQGDKTPNWFD